MDFKLNPKIKTEDRPRDELLKNHIEIPRSLWDELIPGMQVKYEGTDGKIRTGGFVIAIIDVKDTETGVAEKAIRISNFPRKFANKQGYTEFNVRFKNITKLWKYIDRFSFFEFMRVQEIIKHIKERIDKSDARVESINTRVVNIEKKVDKILSAIELLSKKNRQ